MRLLKQYAALPYRVRDGALEVLLITSRDSGRWVIPKGNPIPGLSGPRTAAREAYEEAGIEGAVGSRSLGRYRYVKRRADGSERDAEVRVYPLAFARQLADWPERGQRALAWHGPSEAAARVAEPGLAALIRDFRPPEPGAAPPRSPLRRLLAWWRG